MRYDSRSEVERIGRAGSKVVRDKRGLRWRFLSRFWLYVEEDDRAFTPHGPDGFWEAWITAWMSRELEHCEIFIDVGANVGYYTMMAASARVQTISVEPLPHLYNMLYDSAMVNKCKDKVEIIPLAFSDKAGTIRMIIPNLHSGGAAIWVEQEATPINMIDYDVVTVEQRRLDRALALGFMPKNILMKIDAEGAEPRIWAGMQETWQRHNVTVTLEWQGDRWSDTIRNEFVDQLFQNKVSVINGDGTEDTLTREQLLAINDLIMIVVRKND